MQGKPPARLPNQLSWMLGGDVFGSSMAANFVGFEWRNIRCWVKNIGGWGWDTLYHSTCLGVISWISCHCQFMHLPMHTYCTQVL
jgi:hypothetical protein